MQYLVWGVRFPYAPLYARIVQWIERLATDQQMRVQVLLRTPFRADERDLLISKTLATTPLLVSRVYRRGHFQVIRSGLSRGSLI